jgi:hypothetical protein
MPSHLTGCRYVKYCLIAALNLHQEKRTDAEENGWADGEHYPR